MLNLWESLCKGFASDKLSSALRVAAPSFRPVQDSLEAVVDDDLFNKAEQIGLIELQNAQSVIVATIHTKRELNIRSGKRKQYELAKRILRYKAHDAGIFAFYDDSGRFRFSLVTVAYHGTKREYSTFKRYTFYVDPCLSNKTFIQQIQKASFTDISGILETFSIEAVSDEFYREFKDHYDRLSNGVQGTNNEVLKRDFALLFAIRIIFLGFVQKKGWLGDNPRFMQDFLDEYKQLGSSDTLYKEWLEPLFFGAFNSPPGSKEIIDMAPLSNCTKEILHNAPYLNGELFKRKQNVDDCGLRIMDQSICEFFDFLFQYNFTVEENELYDEELDLNPEFLGIILERITNKDQGAVYTPRVEVDLMCRLALVKWLEQNTDIPKEKLYHLFFKTTRAGEIHDNAEDQSEFSPDEIRTLVERLETVTICDPAAGSGAFEVGMLQVLDQVLEDLYTRENTPQDLKSQAPTPFERKKAIISRSLYGVDVQRWAVWINQLRLWLTLFVDMPETEKHSSEPLLPNLSFKVRTGDSLVQRVGSKTFPVHGNVKLSKDLERRITRLKCMKSEFFYNKKTDSYDIEHEELDIFRTILDEEIIERSNKIRMLQEPRHESGPLPFSVEDIGPEQKKLDFAHVIERLQRELEELNEQKNNLIEERPFIWSIEFPEIFFERGGFDIIIGNPPYVRQEHISDPNGNLDPATYKDALTEMVLIDFPSHFAKSELETSDFKPGRKPSGRSDLYTYFYIRSLRLLNKNGVHVFICSNSWLDVDFGTWLQEFFLYQTPLYFVIDNHARRSFARADVNTVITVAGSPRGVKESHMIRFVAFKKPFEDVIASDSLLAIEQAMESLPTDDFRVVPRAVGELLYHSSEVAVREEIDCKKPTLELVSEISPSYVTESGFKGISISPRRSFLLGKYLGDKWGGKYLRAPEIFFTILEKGKGKLVRLGDIAEVRFGIKTGANDFFYLEPLGPGSKPGSLRVRNGAGWEGEIEEEFLKPVIKSPREITSVMIKPESLRYCVFLCHRRKGQLGGTRALEYIKWGEKQGFSEGATCRTRSLWWAVPYVEGNVFWGKELRERIAVFASMLYLPADCRLYVSTGDTTLQTILNSVVSFLVDEIQARQYGGGGGPRSLMVYEVNQQLILAPDAIADRVNHVLEIFPRFASRPIGSIFTECGIDPRSDIPISEQEPNPLPDRKALDDIVFDALELTKEQQKEVYRAVCQLVWDRISRARSVD